jgi:type II secretory pathway pseudopilin PulG
MKRFLHPTNAFSLVEVTLALGVAGFCLIAVLGLLPVGIQTNQRSISQTVATGILSSVIADLRATPKTSPTSTQYLITFRTAKTLYFDNSGRCSTNSAGSLKPDGSSWSPPIQTRYQLNVTFPPNAGFAYNPTYADLKVTWPATATAANARGSSEMFSALNRNP